MFKNEAAEFVYYRTYAKWDEQLKRRQTWEETVDRVINFLKDERGDKVPPKVFKKIKQSMLDFSVLPSMRLVWSAGPAAKASNVCIYNCSFLPVDSIESFAECLYILCCGSGVGFSVERKYTQQLPIIKPIDRTHTPRTCFVGDSKEAWADSVKMLLENLYEGKNLEFDYSNIRPKGTPLKTMGGRASGPEPLAVLHASIKQIFNNAQGRKLTSLECHDIMNKIAEIVVSGGVRRSSEISLSDLDDEEMQNAKVWPFPLHRAMANNSAVYYEKPSAVDFLKEWSSLASSGTGERGISNLGATRALAPKRRNGNRLDGFNPCQPGFAKITTRLGNATLNDIDVGSEILTKEGFAEVIKKWSTGVQPVYEYKTAFGSFVGTKNHKVETETQLGRVLEEVQYCDYLISNEDLIAPVISETYLGDFEVFDITVDNESHTYFTDNISVSNCHEIALRSYEFCNLSTIVVTPEDDLESLLEKVETATWIGIIQATFTDFPYLRPIWKQNCDEERLLGISLSGQMDNTSVLTSDALKAMKQKALKVAKRASEKLNIYMPAAITCGKPEGCQTSDTSILTSEGILTLEEIGNIRGESWQDIKLTVDQDNAAPQQATKFFINGKKPIKILHMRSGAVLKATHNHKYRIIKNNEYIWTRTDQIVVGDHIPYKIGNYNGGKIQVLQKSDKPPHPNSTIINFPDTLDTEFAFFLGLYFADGSNHNRGIRISGDKRKKETLNKVAAYFRSLGANVNFLDDQKTNKTQLYINSQELKRFLTINGLSKQSKYEVKIPLLVRKSTKEVLQSFVEGYQAGDGCETSRGNAVVTVSLQMAKELQVVGRALGKAVTLNLMPPTESSLGGAMRYRVTFRHGREGAITKSPYRNMYKDLDALGLTTLIPDVVVGIENAIENTYDISVPCTETFIANSYISHNTTSQLVSSGSGAHSWYSPYFIRRYRIAGTDPLFKMMRDQGFKFTPENGQTEDNATTWVVSFPVKAPEGAVFRNDLTAIQQLEWYKKVQTNWCEHNQSITVYVKDHEWFDVGNWVYNNWDICVGVSFLPYDGGKYEQAPYEEITEEKYNKLIKNFPKINYSKLSEYEQEDLTEGAKTFACVGDKCELK